LVRGLQDTRLDHQAGGLRRDSPTDPTGLALPAGFYRTTRRVLPAEHSPPGATGSSTASAGSAASRTLPDPPGCRPRRGEPGRTGPAPDRRSAPLPPPR